MFTAFDFNACELLLVPIFLLVSIELVRPLGRFIVERLRKSGATPDSILLIRRIFYVVVIIVLAVTSLEILNMPITAFAFLSGAAAIGVGFGAKNIVNN